MLKKMFKYFTFWFNSLRNAFTVERCKEWREFMSHKTGSVFTPINRTIKDNTSKFNHIYDEQNIFEDR